MDLIHMFDDWEDEDNIDEDDEAEEADIEDGLETASEALPTVGGSVDSGHEFDPGFHVATT